MRWLRKPLTGLGVSALLAVGPYCTAQTAPTMAPLQTSPPAQAAEVNPAERESQALLDQLGKVGEAILKDTGSEQSWRLQNQQAALMIRLAGLATSRHERDRWLRMAVDSYASAVGT